MFVQCRADLCRVAVIYVLNGTSFDRLARGRTLDARRSMFDVQPQRRRSILRWSSDRPKGAERSPKNRGIVSGWASGPLPVVGGQSTTTQTLRVEPHQSVQPTLDKEAYPPARWKPPPDPGWTMPSRKAHAPPNRAPTNRTQMPSVPEPVRSISASQSSEGVQKTLTWASPSLAARRLRCGIQYANLLRRVETLQYAQSRQTMLTG